MPGQVEEADVARRRAELVEEGLARFRIFLELAEV